MFLKGGLLPIKFLCLLPSATVYADNVSPAPKLSSVSLAICFFVPR